MQAVYTKQSIEASGFAGLQSSRITEIFHGYPYNQSISKRIIPLSTKHNNVMLTADDIGFSCDDYHNFHTDTEEGEQQKGISKIHVNRPTYSIKKKITNGIATSVEKCFNDIENSYCCENLPRIRTAKTYQRRLATPEEHKTSFNRSYICTDEKSGRTEMLTTRRVGSATLDIDITDFDVYASHLGRRLVAACGKRKNEEHINLADEYVEPPARFSKAFHKSNLDSITTNEGFMVAKKEKEVRSSLGRVRRKVTLTNIAQENIEL